MTVSRPAASLTQSSAPPILNGMTLPRPDDERFWPRTGFCAPPYPFGEYENARAVILPVPYDSTVTARAGARDGPDAIIASSGDIEHYDIGLGYEPYRHGIFTSPAVAVTNESPEAMINRVHAVAGDFLEAGKFLVTLGGEHTIAVGSFRAHRDRYARASASSPSTPTRTYATNIRTRAITMPAACAGCSTTGLLLKSGCAAPPPRKRS